MYALMSSALEDVCFITTASGHSPARRAAERLLREHPRGHLFHGAPDLEREPVEFGNDGTATVRDDDLLMGIADLKVT